MRKMVMNSLGIVREIEDDDEMTLRDYFAAKAIAPLIQYISCGYEGDLDGDDFICVANDAYKIADIMMKARGKNESI